jgi:hypothetical protein
LLPFRIIWSWRTESNGRPADYKSAALPAELRQLKQYVDVQVMTSINMAEWTGLEPATPGVTGRYSNQLNYHSANKLSFCNLVGAEGLEPPTLAV